MGIVFGPGPFKVKVTTAKNRKILETWFPEHNFWKRSCRFTRHGQLIAHNERKVGIENGADPSKVKVTAAKNRKSVLGLQSRVKQYKPNVFLIILMVTLYLNTMQKNEISNQMRNTEKCDFKIPYMYMYPTTWWGPWVQSPRSVKKKLFFFHLLCSSLWFLWTYETILRLQNQVQGRLLKIDKVFSYTAKYIYYKCLCLVLSLLRPSWLFVF